jgi:hypothetical protein
MIRSRTRRLMQVHAVRCQKLAWPLFHKISQGRDAAVWKTRSRGFHSLSLNSAQTALSFRRDRSVFARGTPRPSPTSQACRLWCDDDDAEQKEAESPAWLDVRCSWAMLRVGRVFRPSGDLASRCRPQVATGCHALERRVRVVRCRAQLLVRFRAHSSQKKRPLSPRMHPPPPPLGGFSILSSGVADGTLNKSN